ncbi:MAG: TSUP family transporter [Thermodesulfobacteriota bacterium]
MHEMILLFLIAVIVGVVGGMIGIGGAVFLIPMLIYLFSWPEKLAQGTTLAMLLPPVSLLAAIQYYKNGELKIGAAVVIALCFIPGEYVGAVWGNRLPPDILSKIFGTFAILVGLKMLWPQKKNELGKKRS